MTIRKTMSPYEAKNIDDVCALRLDNKSYGDYWITTDGNTVTITEQEVGYPTKSSVEVPRRIFNYLVDWYMREQKLRSVS